MTPTRSDQEYTHDTLRALIAEARERVAIYAFDIGGSTQLDERETGILNDVVAWYDAHVVPFAYAWEKQLEAVKAREETLRAIASGTWKPDDLHSTALYGALASGDQTAFRYAFMSWAQALARKTLAASEPPGEEGT